MHYGKVVMERRTFKFITIQSKILLSLSNLLSFASKSLKKLKSKSHIFQTLSPHFCYKGVFAKMMHKANIVAFIKLDFLRPVLTVEKKYLQFF